MLAVGQGWWNNAAMNTHEGLVDPELTPAQSQIKALADEILALKSPDNPLTFWNYATSLDALEVQNRLSNIRIGELLLKGGDSLSAPKPNKYWPDLGLYANNDTLKVASLRAWGWEFEKSRIDPKGPSKPPYKVINFPGEYDWARQLDLVLAYSDGRQAAVQSLTAYTATFSAGETPRLSRDVSAAAYAEQGYEGHNQKFLENVTEEDVIAFTGLCRYLFERPASAN